MCCLVFLETHMDYQWWFGLKKNKNFLIEGLILLNFVSQLCWKKYSGRKVWNLLCWFLGRCLVLKGVQRNIFVIDGFVLVSQPGESLKRQKKEKRDREKRESNISRKLLLLKSQREELIRERKKLEREKTRRNTEWKHNEKINRRYTSCKCSPQASKPGQECRS